MTSRRVATTAVFLLASCAVGGVGAVALAQQRPATGWTPLPKDEQAVFDGMVRASTPGEPHELLATLAGDWTFTSKIWMNPDRPPEVSGGTATNAMVMGGRYLRTSYTGSLMGAAFEGLGITGYDNTSDRYQAVWLDNTSTVLMFLTGSYDKDTRRLILRAELNDLAHPEVVVPIREVLTFVDADSHTMEVFETRGGREVKTLELAYRRKP